MTATRILNRSCSLKGENERERERLVVVVVAVAGAGSGSANAIASDDAAVADDDGSEMMNWPVGEREREREK